jgi:DHA1 family bicyclomycin/chloramphenicol resistance-like MFS transporter
MADQTATIDSAPLPEVSSTFAQIAVLAALAATGTLATNILLPSLPQMAASLKVSTAAVTSAITLFLAVFALGQLVVGPISDRYGRRWPVLTGFAVFCAGSIWCGLATDLPGLLTGRVIQAAGACATSVLSRAIARDLFSGAALGPRDGADHGCDGGGARLLAAARRRARPRFRLAFRIRLCRNLCGDRRDCLWRGARRNP